MLSVFKPQGRPIGRGTKRMLTEVESRAAHQYILLNCEEVKPYIEQFVSQLQQWYPDITPEQVDYQLENQFAHWFRTYVTTSTSTSMVHQLIKDLSLGPLQGVTSYRGYFVNGFRFHAEAHSVTRLTSNNGVCIKGSNYSADESDYYGKLTEVLELEYPALPIKRVILFMCDWFDPTPNTGTKVHTVYRIAEVNCRRRFHKYEPFVLASQAAQVYYVPYPSLKRDRNDWLAVCKMRARAMVDVPESSSAVHRNIEPFQEEDIGTANHGIQEDNEDHLLNDPNRLFVDIEGREHNEDDDNVHETESSEEERESDDDCDENNNYEDDSSDD